MMAITNQEKVKKAISLYCTNLRRTSICLKGGDLKALGLEPGPMYRRIFQAVFDAKLNGRAATREDELAFARRLVHDHEALAAVSPARRHEE
jgi:tRNA nucleotidyltransferase (CCA-adding enzyme)